MKRCLSITVLTMMFALSVNAQTTTAAPSAGELTKLLNEFLIGASRNDAVVHDRFWADDVIYTGSGGRRRGKPEIMHDVRSAPAPKPGEPTTDFTAEDIRIQQYGDTAIVAFHLVATTRGPQRGPDGVVAASDGMTEVMNYLNSGTFIKRNGKWQVVNWQSTKMPSETATKELASVGSVEPSVTLPPELARVLADYESAWKAGNAAALANLFAEDGYVLAEGRGPTKGRAAIRKLYAHPGAPLSLRAISYAMQGDVGYIIGGYSAVREKPDDGKFTLTLRKNSDGQWLIVSDMDNSNRR
jgi:ketosteroid isomerase-like protein